MSHFVLRCSRSCSCYLLAAALLSGISGRAAAQDFGTVAPSQPVPAKPGTLHTPPTPTGPAPAENKRLLDNLIALRFVPTVQAIKREGATGAGIQIESLSLMDNPVLRAQLAAFLGKPLMTADLPRISKLVIDWYRAHNRPLVDVAFPEQDITGGVVQAVVTDYKLGKVAVSGNNWFSSDLLRSEMDTVPGVPVDFSILKTDLNRLNRNPFRTVDAVFEKSDIVGDTDIALKVQDRFPWRFFAGYDNGGTAITGRDRYNIGFNAGNLFGLDHQASYSYITSPDLWRTRDRGAGLSNDPRFTAHSFTYQAPVVNGDTLNVFGSYVEQVPDLGPDFGQVGHSAQISLRYQKDLPTFGNYSQQIQAGFDFRRFDNNLAFGGTQVFASRTKIAQFLLTYDATRTDATGQTLLENEAVFSPGNLFPGNDTPTYQASGVAHSSATYGYDNLQLTRVQSLPLDASLVGRVTGQFASGELLPSEQLGAGGVGSIRGYDVRVANGSDGVLTSLELRSPPYGPLARLVDPTIGEQGQLLAFWDYGYVAFKAPQQNLPQNTALQSVGIGARYGISRYLDARFDYGWQLDRVPGATKLGNLANVSVTLSY